MPLPGRLRSLRNFGALREESNSSEVGGSVQKVTLLLAETAFHTRMLQLVSRVPLLLQVLDNIPEIFTE